MAKRNQKLVAVEVCSKEAMVGVVADVVSAQLRLPTRSGRADGTARRRTDAMIEEAPDPMALALSPTGNSMVAVYGADARGRRCASCESYDYRARVCRIKGLRLPHKGSHAACARYRGRD